MTWKDSLKVAFEAYTSYTEVDPVRFPDLMKENGLSMNDTLRSQFESLSPDQKKRVIKGLWDLVYVDKLSAKDRIELYNTMSRFWEQFFESDEAEYPGWV